MEKRKSFMKCNKETRQVQLIEKVILIIDIKKNLDKICKVDKPPNISFIR